MIHHLLAWTSGDRLNKEHLSQCTQHEMVSLTLNLTLFHSPHVMRVLPWLTLHWDVIQLQLILPTWLPYDLSHALLLSDSTALSQIVIPLYIVYAVLYFGNKCQILCKSWHVVSWVHTCSSLRLLSMVRFEPVSSWKSWNAWGEEEWNSCTWIPG